MLLTAANRRNNKLEPVQMWNVSDLGTSSVLLWIMCARHFEAHSIYSNVFFPSKLKHTSDVIRDFKKKTCPWHLFTFETSSVSHAGILNMRLQVLSDWDLNLGADFIN